MSTTSRLLGEDQVHNGHFQRKNSGGISLLSIYHVHKQVSPVTLNVDWTPLLFQQTLGFYIVTNIHNFDSETLLAFFYDDHIGTINHLSNHHQLENHVHAKTCAVHFLRNHACAEISFALFLSIEETEPKPFTFQILTMVPKLTGQNKTARAI